MHSQCQNGAIEISSDIAEFRGLLWTLENVYKTSEVRVEIPTEADGTYDAITSARIPAPGAETTRLVRFYTSFRILGCGAGWPRVRLFNKRNFALDSVTNVLARITSFRDRSCNIRGDMRCRSELPESQRRENSRENISYLLKRKSLFAW